MTPCLKVYREKIYENARRVLEACSRCSINLTAVTKGASAAPEIVKTLWESGCRSFGDSRLANIKEIKKIFPEAETTLIRPPMASEIPELALYADNVLVSMWECLPLLNGARAKTGKALGIILMVEMGDLRDGIMPDEIEVFADFARSHDNLRLRGVAANFGCFGAILPTKDKLEQLVDIKLKLERMGHEELICSGGASSSLLLLERGEIPRGVNGLRVGEAILTGTDVTRQRDIGWLNRDTMILETEIIEIRRKPSAPLGESGVDAFGNPQFFEDRGERLRGIAAIGRQDVNVSGLSPLLDGIEILGASSDHIVLDLEAVKNELRYGNTLGFTVSYSAMLALFTSKYVKIEFI